MDATYSLMAILTGLFLRLALPIALTIIAIVFLRKLDTRWQAEAELEASPPAGEKAKCWDIKGCSPEQRSSCPATKSSLPCWQTFRLPNGYLRDECLTCEVFRDAPVAERVKVLPV